MLGPLSIIGSDQSFMFSLMGNRRGRKVIRWSCVCGAALLITAIASPVAAGLYAAFTRRWEPRLLLIGPIAGFVVTGLTLSAAWRTPIQRLPLIR
jgi:hypothetical protein